MSHIRPLRLSDRIFFVTANLHRQVCHFVPSEYPLLIEALEGAHRRLGFLLYGYVLMPDHWHALIWTAYPLTISQAIHDVKKASARELHRKRGTEGPVWQHQFWDRFVRHAREFSDRLEYMHLNPVRQAAGEQAGPVAMSSYNNFSLDWVTVGLVQSRLITSAFQSNTGHDFTENPTVRKALTVATSLLAAQFLQNLVEVLP